MLLRQAYIILAHKNPEQLFRLLKRIDNRYAQYFIHIDIKSNINIFSETLKQFEEKITLVAREDGAWGKFGIVKATINGLLAIQKSKKNFDFIHLISGQDYPIKDPNALAAFLSKNKGKSFINHKPMPSKDMKFGGMDRLYNYHFWERGHKPKVHKAVIIGVELLINKLFVPVFLPKRRFPANLMPFIGSQWWSITGEAAEVILDFIVRRPDYVDFHKYSLLPDEMFFQTILVNESKLKGKLVNDNLRYIDWTKPNVKSYPVLFKKEDYNSLISTEKFWGRKFDANVDVSILDMLDKSCDVSSL